MELTLKRLLEHAEFKKYRGKGYDPTEVDDFLDRAAAMAGKVEVQLTQALDKAKSAGNGGAAGPDPAAIEAEIERRVAEEVAKQASSAPTGPSEDDIAQEAQRTLVMAQRTADAAVREAREDAEKLVAAAKEQSDALLADAEARASAVNQECDERAASSKAEVEAEAAAERREARQRLAQEVGALEGIRETLRSDVNGLERHVEEQRSQLGSTLAELQQILDDPSGFRLAPPPVLADPELPDFSDLDESDARPAAQAEADPVVEAEPEPEPDFELDPEDEPEPELEDEPALELDPELAVAPAAEETEPGEAQRPSAPQPLTFDEVDHEAPGLDEPNDSGPPTAPVSAVDLGLPAEDASPAGDEPIDPNEDAFLAELRKAMADDEPLGPRDHEDLPPSDEMFDDEDRRGWRFGRRR